MKVNTTLTKSVAEKEMRWRKASVLESKLQLKNRKESELLLTQKKSVLHIKP